MKLQSLSMLFLEVPRDILTTALEISGSWRDTVDILGSEFGQPAIEAIEAASLAEFDTEELMDTQEG